MPEYWYEEWTDRNRVKRRREIVIESEPKPNWDADSSELCFIRPRPHQYCIWLTHYANGEKDKVRSSYGEYDTYNEALEVIHKDFPRAIKDWR